MPRIYLNFYFKNPSLSEYHFYVSMFIGSLRTSDWLRLDDRLASSTFVVYPGPISGSYDGRIHWFERLPIQGKKGGTN